MRFLGYSWLQRAFDLNTVDHFCVSVIPEGAALSHDDQEVRNVRRELDPGDDALGQLAFALKHEGLNLEITRAALCRMDPAEVASYADAYPTSRYARLIGFLFEGLTGTTLPVADRSRGNYVDLLDPASYYTGPQRLDRRWRVRNNLPGTLAYCPLVRRTPELDEYTADRIRERLAEACAPYDDALLQRAVSYLHLTETRSSFEIEQEPPSQDKAQRFAETLRGAGRHDTPTIDELSEIQRQVLPANYKGDYGVRARQNFVGSRGRQEYVAAIGAPQQYVDQLTRGWIEAFRIASGQVDAVPQAAAYAFGWVFLHPFSDGNGRIHRFLVHDILKREGVLDDDLIVPVSASMQAHPGRYTAALETFSRHLRRIAVYDVDRSGELQIDNPDEIVDAYRYFDATEIALYLYQAIEHSITHDFAEELRFLAAYDRARPELEEVLGLPDDRLDQFISLWYANGCRLSNTKRRRLYGDVPDGEIEEATRILDEAFQVDRSPDDTDETGPRPT